MERYLIIFKGRVQGVGFRYTCMLIANKYNLTGYGQNLDNGDVKVEIQGTKQAFTNFLKDILNSENSFINIEDYAIKKIEVKEKEKNFTIRY